MPTEMNVEQRAIAGLKWTAMARLLGQFASWASTLLVFRLLEPADYGLMAIVMTLIGIGGAIAEFGLGASMIQVRQLDRTLLSRLAGVVVLFHLAMLALMVALGPLAAWFYQDHRLSLLIQVAAVQFLFGAAGAVPYALAARAMNFALLARVELLTMVIGSLCTLGMAMLGYGVWALIGGMLIAAAARALMLTWAGENVRPSFRFAGLGLHLKYSASMASSHVLWTVVSQSDVIIGGRLLTRDALGLYSVALHLATLPMSKIMGVVNQVAFAAVARMQEETDRLRNRILQAARLMTAIGVGLMWGAAAVAPELIRVVLGPKWEAAIIPLQLVSLVVPLRMLVMLLATGVGGVGAADVNLRNTLTAAVVLPLCFAVGAQWGATGLAAAWLLATPLTFALNARRIGATLNIRVSELLRLLICPAVAGILMGVAITAARLQTPDLADGLRLVLLIGVGATTYAFALLLTDRRLWPDMRRLVALGPGRG